MAPDASALEPAQQPAWQAYDARLGAARAALATLDARSARIANLRTVAFLAAAGVAALTVFGQLPSLGWGVAAVGLAAYAGLATWHDRVFAAESRERQRVDLNQRGMARLCGQWRMFASQGDRFVDAAHLYSPDLDVFGKGSLFQLLDETASVGAEALLGGWLGAPAALEVARERQGAVRELAPLVDFRQALAIEGRLAAKDKADASRFIAWAEQGPGLAGLGWARWAAFALPPLTLAAFVAWQVDALSVPLFWLGLFGQGAVIAATRRRVGAVYERISAGEGGFLRFGPVFATLESRHCAHPRLAALRAGLDGAGAKVSQRLARFSRLLAFAELRQSPQMHAVIDLLLLWDVHTFHGLEAWRKENGRQVRAWFEALYETEALSCLAGFAHDRPHYAWPELAPDGPRFEARGLGHPLLDRAVKNDVTLPGRSTALIVTGSNMSGKTTLLRATGLAAVMAQVGLPVCADALTCSSLAVLTSMRVKDSLERGVSYFYAEVQRIKAVLDAAAAAGGRALFLVDELLLGTNTRERQIASRELAKQLLATGASGALTTHDLSLTELADGVRVQNVHFSDQLSDGKMSFDYRLREGVVSGTNALRVLELAGIAVRDPDRPGS